MNKKLMAVAVAGAFAAPSAAFAQASNVQIFGTAYMEYAYASQGTGSKGTLQNIDIMQSPGSEIGFRGEEALGGGMSAWFQCASTADIRGANATAVANDKFAGTSGIFCGRNSAIGLKGSLGNLYAGNWDTPMKKLAGASRIVADTGIWGTAGLLFGNSSTYGDNGPSTSATSTAALSFSRRQGQSIFYDSPEFSGFQVSAVMSTPINAISATANQTGAKARLWGAGISYVNGPLALTAAYELHQNFQVGAGTYATATTLTTAANAYTGNDTAFTLGAAYQFGPVKTGLLYTNRKYDTGNNVAVCGAAVNTDLRIQSLNIAGEWAISGPHALRAGHTRAGDTKGTCVSATTIGNMVANGGAGSTGAFLSQVQYIYNASKRTELTAGYVVLSNDTNAVYSLGGAATPRAGDRQNAFAVSIKNTF